ncbi:MAG TPA: PadR family transcriptional regulator [Clostridia bacterium]|nr:PadR family transcriptional regulator [Clostridia bacterium]
MSEIDKQLKKGVIEILILKLLSLDNMYGYQLIQELDTRSQGIFKMKEGTLYPILYRLEDNNLIESYWEQDNEKRSVPRKYYKITEVGLVEFQNMKSDLTKMFTSIKSILQEGNSHE